ncbi:MAG TPA: MBL fold metallo-hydrolase [Rhodanobacteraceae bacterium]|nr:MBL fold metallo-hydrolase [Rhodanobacteraceae bacterium]
MNLSLRFLGTGDAWASAELGNSSAVLERDGAPWLMIDCGPEALNRYLSIYRAPPAALYITHTHLDHVGGFERLFTTLQFNADWRGRTRVFLHANVLALLHGRVADYPNALAEGGVNFWEAFRLVPCTRGFWLDGCWFDLFQTRHHRPTSSYGLLLRGALAFTGDTRPIPEVLQALAVNDELVAHDCALHGNPSHSGIEDLEREYPPELRQRLLLYHYGSRADGAALAARGYRVAEPDQSIALAAPLPVDGSAG